jgi:hypothetical protein
MNPSTRLAEYREHALVHADEVVDGEREENGDGAAFSVHLTSCAGLQAMMRQP